MTEAQKLVYLKNMTGSSDDTLLSACLAQAANIVIRKAYPFDATVTSVPEIYDWDQINIAEYIFSKRGASGQLAHKENGIDRTYESGDVPDSMLKRIIPFCGGIHANIGD